MGPPIFPVLSAVDADETVAYNASLAGIASTPSVPIDEKRRVRRTTVADTPSTRPSVDQRLTQVAAPGSGAPREAPRRE